MKRSNYQIPYRTLLVVVATFAVELAPSELKADERVEEVDAKAVLVFSYAEEDHEEGEEERGRSRSSMRLDGEGEQEGQESKEAAWLAIVRARVEDEGPQVRTPALLAAAHVADVISIPACVAAGLAQTIAAPCPVLLAALAHVRRLSP